MPLSEKKKASNAKWDATHIVRMSLALTTEESKNMKEHLEVTGEPTNGFIRRAIRETIEREKNGPSD